MRAAVLALLAACGSTPKPAVEEPKISPKPTTRTIVEDDSEPTEGVTVVNQRGRMNVSDIEKGLAPHTQSLTDCYMSRVGKRRWLGGQVEIHWDISKDGDITAVKLASSDLGAWPIEKCLLEIARGATFEKPTGGNADFMVPLSFSAKGVASPWDELQSLKAVGGQTIAFEKCDKELLKREKDGAKKKAPKKDDKVVKHVVSVPPEDVTITMYVGPKGVAQSVGFSSKASMIDDEWGDCAEKAATAWRLPDPRGQVAKLAVKYKPSAGDSSGDDE